MEKRNWKYCVAGNIVKERYDENGVLRHGTPAFRGGTKVYLCGKRLPLSWNDIEVIGLTRGRRYDVVSVPLDHIENVRVSTVYKPRILKIMNDWEFKDDWWHDTPEDKKSAEAFVALWNCERGKNVPK
ncbi:MAG: hypothetical protein IJS65_08530 [Clostridia bacterium]|nr:hypothetical protein [Clostridia bacterium]